MTKHKNIVIGPCRNNSSLFSSRWLTEKDKKTFDLCLLFYHAEIEKPNRVFFGLKYFFLTVKNVVASVGEKKSLRSIKTIAKQNLQVKRIIWVL